MDTRRVLATFDFNTWIRCAPCLATWTACLVGLSSAVRVSAADTMVIQPAQEWACVFGDSEVEFRYAISSEEAFEGRATWRLAFEHRTLQRGERDIRITAGESAELLIPLRVPPVKDGVVFRIQFEMDVLTEPGGQVAARHKRPVWVFPRDPFADRTEWLKSCDITLFDPEGETAAVLEKAGVPFKLVVRTGPLEDLSDGMLVVGEGVSLIGFRGLPNTLYRSAVAGIPVLLLGPSEGSLPLAGAKGSAFPAPASISFRRQDVLQQLDKRFDGQSWPPDGRIPSSLFSVEGGRAGVSLAIAPDAAESAQDAWPWVEIDYNQKGGKLLMCGFHVVSRWESGPVPRFLLARLLEELTNERED